MYCIQCGVELADSEKSCPLCGTRVFHPDLPRADADAPYPAAPRGKGEEFNRAGLLFILTMLAMLPVVICLLCDWNLNGHVVWSGYAAGGIVLAYIIVVLPLWFRRPNPVVFVPVDFVAILGYLLYIDLATAGHWFMPFAFPAVGALAVLVSAMVALLRYLRGGHLFVFGGAMILGGGLAVFTELLLNAAFGLRSTLLWSLYPLAAGVILGAALIVIGICRPLRQSLHRKFFL